MNEPDFAENIFLALRFVLADAADADTAADAVDELCD